MMGAGIGRPLGLALVGLLLQNVGTTWTILLYGLVFLGLALASTLYAPVRHAPRVG